MRKIHIPAGILAVLIIFISARLIYRAYHAMLYEIGFEQEEIWLHVNMVSHLIIIIILLGILIAMSIRHIKASTLTHLPPLLMAGTLILFIAFTAINAFQDTITYLGGGLEYLYSLNTYVFNLMFISALTLMLFSIGKEYWKDFARNLL